MKKTDLHIDEIRRFLADFRTDKSGFSEQHRASIEAAYKQFHAVLVWHLVATKACKHGSSARLFYSECTSDLSHGFLLSLMHIYKPARMSLRSCIENFLRALLHIEGVDGSKIGAVYQLFDTTKSQFATHTTVAALLAKLEATYGELCKTVHSAKVDYMSLTIPFEQIAIFNPARYRSNLTTIQSVSSAMNRILFLIWHKNLKSAGHQNADLIRDSIPKTLKREVSSKQA